MFKNKYVLKYEGTNVTAKKVPVQQQHGSVDFGRFAIANIVVICFDQEPSKLTVFSDETN